jgi:hypothetical protein
MTVRKTDQEGVSARLHEAIEGLRKDVTRVEIWATALLTFTQSVPDYKADPKYELGQPVDAGPLAKNHDPEPTENRDEKASD